MFVWFWILKGTYTVWLNFVNHTYVYMQGDHTSMNQQVSKFGETVQEMTRFFRGDANAMNSYIGKCMFYSGLGSNDYLNNYFMPTFYTTSSDFTPKAFAAALLQDYKRQLTVSLIKCASLSIYSFFFFFFFIMHIFRSF